VFSSASSVHSGSAKLGIGASMDNGSGTAKVDGYLDEVRIRTGLTSSAWFAAEHTNQDTTTTFYTIGSQTAA